MEMSEEEDFRIMADPAATEAEKNAAADRIIDRALAGGPRR